MQKADSSSDVPQLNGLKVLVTRPLEQSASLANAIHSRGGTAHCFPLLEIQPVIPCAPALEQLNQYNLVIFVSRNAVEYAWPCLSIPLPESLIVGAVGKATAASLQQHHQQVHIMPAEQFDSEGLLAQAELEDVTGQRVLIIRGQGGREFLAETLRARGAIVDYAEVYKRVPTEQALTYEASDIDVILITSSEALSHLARIASQEGKSWILEKPLLVIHERIAVRAKQLGFKLNPGVAEQSSEASLLDALDLFKD